MVSKTVHSLRQLIKNHLFSEMVTVNENDNCISKWQWWAIDRSIVSLILELRYFELFHTYQVSWFCHVTLGFILKSVLITDIRFLTSSKNLRVQVSYLLYKVFMLQNKMLKYFHNVCLKTCTKFLSNKWKSEGLGDFECNFWLGELISWFEKSSTLLEPFWTSPAPPHPTWHLLSRKFHSKQKLTLLFTNMYMYFFSRNSARCFCTKYLTLC